MGLLRDTWLALWRGSRGGGILTMAFWYTLIITLYEYLVASRLGHSIPQGLTRLIKHPGVVALPHLAEPVLIKLILVYLTFLIIILPFTIGGLYGGVAEVIHEKPQYLGFLAFFRFGYRNFWRAWTQILLALCYAVLLFAMLFGLVAGLGALMPNNSVMAVIAVIIIVAGLLWLAGTLMYWFGQTFSTDVSPLKGWFQALGRAARNPIRMYGQIILLVVTLMVALIVLTFLANTIPFVGEILLVLVLGMVAPAFVAIYAILSYQQAR